MSSTPEGLAEPLAGRIVELVHSRGAPVVVGLDGRSGSGKSTLARALAALFGRAGTTLAIIEGDDFYAGGSAATWDGRSAREKADGVIDWRRQHQVLGRLREDGVAEWHPFDWEADGWDGDDAPLVDRAVEVTAGDVVLLEGAYSCRPELHDLLDLRVLLDVPTDVRRRQLLEREGEHYRPDWEARWGEAEEHYFGAVMPPSAFDLVIEPD